MCLRSQWGSIGVSSTKAPARGEGTSSGRRSYWPGSERSSPGTNSLYWAWPISFPCHHRCTSLCCHHHCLHHVGRGDGGWDEETVSLVKLPSPGGTGSWKEVILDVYLGQWSSRPESQCRGWNFEDETRAQAAQGRRKCWKALVRDQTW